MNPALFRRTAGSLLPALERISGGSMPMLLMGGGLVAVGVLVKAIADRVASTDGVEVEFDTEANWFRVRFDADSSRASKAVG